MSAIDIRCWSAVVEGLLLLHFYLRYPSILRRHGEASVEGRRYLGRSRCGMPEDRSHRPPNIGELWKLTNSLFHTQNIRIPDCSTICLCVL